MADNRGEGWRTTGGGDTQCLKCRFKEEWLSHAGYDLEGGCRFLTPFWNIKDVNGFTVLDYVEQRNKMRRREEGKVACQDYVNRQNEKKAAEERELKATEMREAKRIAEEEKIRMNMEIEKAVNLRRAAASKLAGERRRAKKERKKKEREQVKRQEIEKEVHKREQSERDRERNAKRKAELILPTLTNLKLPKPQVQTVESHCAPAYKSPPENRWITLTPFIISPTVAQSEFPNFHGQSETSHIKPLHKIHPDQHWVPLTPPSIPPIMAKANSLEAINASITPTNDALHEHYSDVPSERVASKLNRNHAMEIVLFDTVPHNLAQPETPGPGRLIIEELAYLANLKDFIYEFTSNFLLLSSNNQNLTQANTLLAAVANHETRLKLTLMNCAWCSAVHDEPSQARLHENVKLEQKVRAMMEYLWWYNGLVTRVVLEKMTRKYEAKLISQIVEVEKQWLAIRNQKCPLPIPSTNINHLIWMLGRHAFKIQMETSRNYLLCWENAMVWESIVGIARGINLEQKEMRIMQDAYPWLLTAEDIGRFVHLL